MSPSEKLFVPKTRDEGLRMMIRSFCWTTGDGGGGVVARSGGSSSPGNTKRVDVPPFADAGVAVDVCSTGKTKRLSVPPFDGGKMLRSCVDFGG